MPSLSLLQGLKQHHLIQSPLEMMKPSNELCSVTILCLHFVDKCIGLWLCREISHLVMQNNILFFNETFLVTLYLALYIPDVHTDIFFLGINNPSLYSIMTR